MGYRRLFIWVEGEDDIRFFNTIIRPLLEKKYNYVQLIAYPRMKKEKRASFLESIKAMHAFYIYVADINREPCITSKKRAIKRTLINIDEQRIAIVIKEIESWYLAGLGKKQCEGLRIRHLSCTDGLTKERFNNLIPQKFDLRRDFMVEILKSFSIKTGKQKNKSFRYFMENHDC